MRTTGRGRGRDSGEGRQLADCQAGATMPYTMSYTQFRAADNVRSRTAEKCQVQRKRDRKLRGTERVAVEGEGGQLNE